MYIRRVQDPSGNHHNIRVKLGDLPFIDIGDERYAIGVGAGLLGVLAGGIGIGIIARRRANTLRRHLIAARNDVDNTRKIAQNDVHLAKQYGATKVFKDLLLTCDNMDRALSASTESPSEEAFASLHSGIELTRKELQKVLGQHGVAPIPLSVGDGFSPDLCEAMMTRQIPPAAASHINDDNDAENGDGSGGHTPSPGTISDVFLPGYTLHDRVLRPVQVSVYSSDPSRTEEGQQSAG